MTRAVYLHVGAPKTGTTYLQDRLSRNARSLARHGVHLPHSRLSEPALFQFRAALDLLGQDWGGPPGHARGSWSALVRRINRSSGTVIVSHEILAPARPDRVRQVAHDLRDSELHIVYSARDLGRQLPAAWQESIKQGNSWTFARFLDRVERGKPWFYRAFDLPKVLATWGAAVPRERLHLVTVPPAQAPRTDELWSRMCTAFGIDPAWAPRDSEHVNRSLGIAETQVIRRLNRRMQFANRREPHYDKLIRQMLAQDELAHRPSEPLRLPPERYAWAEAQATRWISWIERHGVHVVGDVTDLWPMRAPADEPWQDPDVVRPKQQLTVALDALAAMTREAANRPDLDRWVHRRARTYLSRQRDR